MTLPLPSPITAAVGTKLSASIWNSNVRDAVNFLLNPPTALLYASTTQSLTNNTGTPIAFNLEVYDTYNGHSTTTNNSRYVGLIPGNYLCIAQLSIATNATGIRNPEIQRNGSPLSPKPISRIAAISTPQSTGQVSAVVTLNGTTDYVELIGLQNSGGQFEHGGERMLAVRAMAARLNPSIATSGRSGV